MFSPIMALLFTYCHIWNLFFILSTLNRFCEWLQVLLEKGCHLAIEILLSYIFMNICRASSEIQYRNVQKFYFKDWNCSWNTIFDSFNTIAVKNICQVCKFDYPTHRRTTVLEILYYFASGPNISFFRAGRTVGIVFFPSTPISLHCVKKKVNILGTISSQSTSNIRGFGVETYCFIYSRIFNLSFEFFFKCNLPVLQVNNN